MDPEIIIALLAALIPAINNGAEFILKAKAAIGQDSEWTPEQIAAAQAEIDKLKINPEEWQKPQPL